MKAAQKKTIRISKQTREELLSLAEKYETIDFLNGDPSWFMHQVEGKRNQETMAFIASCLSYGSRKAFFPRIQMLLEYTHGEPYAWIKEGRYRHDIPDNDNCFYRLYTNRMMRSFFQALQTLYTEYERLDNYILNYAKPTDRNGKISALTAIGAICDYFNRRGVIGIVPKNTTSCCKRICMFLRWMVRTNSPIDLGLWSDFIDKKTLIIPLDTHVAQQAIRLKLTYSRTTIMKTAQDITTQLLKVFPNDPLKGDFALFGFGINHAE